MRSVWWTRRAVGMHVTLAVVVPACLALCAWQVQRALSGNSLSWAYVFEWPLFAGYAVYMWWRLVHEPVGTAASADAPMATTLATGSTSAGAADGEGPDAALPEGAAEDIGSAPGPVSEEDEELAAYNRYLASLNAQDRPKRW